MRNGSVIVWVHLWALLVNWTKNWRIPEGDLSSRREDEIEKLKEDIGMSLEKTANHFIWYTIFPCGFPWSKNVGSILEFLKSDVIVEGTCGGRAVGNMRMVVFCEKLLKVGFPSICRYAFFELIFVRLCVQFVEKFPKKSRVFPFAGHLIHYVIFVFLFFRRNGCFVLLFEKIEIFS